MATSPSVASYRIAPGALSDPAGAGYLGNPATVGRLVGEFCAHVEAAFGAARGGQVTDLRPRVLEMARVFSGQDPAHPPVKGYHGQSLPGKLQADLGPFWAAHRGEWGDDAVAVLFDWLGAHVLEACRAADGDDDLLEAALRPNAQYAVQVLLGVEKRQT